MFWGNLTIPGHRQGREDHNPGENQRPGPREKLGLGLGLGLRRGVPSKEVTTRNQQELKGDYLETKNLLQTP